MTNIELNLKKEEAKRNAEKKAIASRVAELIKSGVDKQMAKIIAKSELEYKIIAPVTI